MKGLVNLNQWNNQQSKKYDTNSKSISNGIECPMCGEEMRDGDMRMVVATYPPKRQIFCTTCGHKDYRVM
jgi:DNA-directed RNA polymerase subunit RPC12/RpoP